MILKVVTREQESRELERWISSAWRGLWQIYLLSADVDTGGSLTAVTVIALAPIVLVAEDVSAAVGAS
jgi:hypothetical protein